MTTKVAPRRASWLKRHFIPHKDNNHRPHFLRRKNTRLLVVSVIMIELIAFILPSLNFSLYIDKFNLASVLPSLLGTFTNEAREENKLPDLTVSPVLNTAAQMKADDMSRKGYFAHTSPEGLTPWHWLDEAGYQYDYAGENLAINFTESKDVTDAWMNSPTHRANIVKANYREMGTGIATGTYMGKETVFVAQVYGNPRVSAPHGGKVLVKENKSRNQKVLGAATEIHNSIKEPNILEKTLASPRHTTNILLYLILVIVTASLILNIFVVYKKQHVDLITNGLIIISLVGAVLLANTTLAKNLSQNATMISTSIEYSEEHV